MDTTILKNFDFEDDSTVEYPNPSLVSLLNTQEQCLTLSPSSCSPLPSHRPKIEKENKDPFDVKKTIVHDFMQCFDQAKGGLGDFLLTNHYSIPLKESSIAENITDNMAEDTYPFQDTSLQECNYGEGYTYWDNERQSHHTSKDFSMDVTYSLGPLKNKDDNNAFNKNRDNEYSDRTSQPDNNDVEQSSESSAMLKKKPFLKKGSRKEPSALHKVASAVNKNVTSSNTTDAQKEKLEELEKMQREQMEQLEHRISRRAAARKVILKKQKQRDTIEIVKLSDKGELTGRTDIKKFENYSAHKKTMKNQICSDAETVEKNGLRTPPIDDRQTEKDDKPQDQQQTIQDSSLHNCAQKKMSEDYSCNNQFVEQWQVIKAMRKRQEAALRDAERDREEARRWAATERETVQKWVEQQRFYLKREKERLINNSLANERKKKIEALEGKANAAVEYNQKKMKDEIETLKSAMHNLKIDSDAYRSRARISDKRLRDIISDKDNKLEAAKEEISSLQERNNLLTYKVEEYSHKILALKRRLSQGRRQSNPPVITDQTSDPIHDNLFRQTIETDSMEAIQVPSERMPWKKKSLKKSRKSLDKWSSDKWPDKSDSFASGECKNDSEINESKEVSEHENSIAEPSEDWLNIGPTEIHDNSMTVPAEMKPIKESKCVSEIIVSAQEVLSPARSYPVIHPLSPITDSAHSSNGAGSQNGQAPSKGCPRRGSILSNNRRVVRYQNGTQKEILPDGTTMVRYTNGDVKTTYVNAGIVVYYYAAAKTSHTSHPDGLEIYEFPNGQVERHLTSGKKEISFPDGTRKTIFPDGFKETIYPDEVKVLEYTDGRKDIIHPHAVAQNN